MKQGLLIVFLLGYGYMAPMSCTKKQATKELPVPCKQRVNKEPQQTALFGPVPAIKYGQKA